MFNLQSQAALGQGRCPQYANPTIPKIHSGLSLPLAVTKALTNAPRCKTPPVVPHLLLKAPSGARGALWSNTADSVGTWATACLVVSRH